MLNEEQAFSLLKRRIYLDRGLDCKQYKENYLKRRIALRLRATRAKDYTEYLGILRTDPEEYNRLMDELTVNVTQFFRDKDVFRKLAHAVLPDIREAKEAACARSLRVWSAGCASGEEAYSMAILIDRELGREAARWSVRVLGSDIDDASLRVARAADYREIDLLEGVDPDRYFDVEQTGEGPVYRVKEHIRRMVKFEKTNLLEERAGRSFDIILCRNVLIYFDRVVQRRIVESLASNILRMGYLVLGKTETLCPGSGPAFEALFPRERIFKVARRGLQRPSGGSG